MRATTLTLFDQAFLTQTVGAAAAITPETFGTHRWWDATSLNYLSDNATITPSDPWLDLSPNGQHAVTTLSREPILKKNIIGSKSVVRLVGAKHLLFNGGDLALGDFTILCVAVTTADSIFLSKNGVNRQIRVNRNAEHKASWFSGADGGHEVVSNFFTSNAALARMIGYRRADNTQAGRSFVFFDNQSLIDHPLVIIDDFSFGPAQIGIYDGGPLNIDIAELVIYDKALTTMQIQLLYTDYFKPKFSLP